MSGNSFGEIFKVTTWGESHGKAVGAVIDGCPSNIEISEEYIEEELKKRRPGSTKFVSPRKETDKVEILSGVLNGKTLGTPISLIIYNKDINSFHYENLKGVFRPGHGDYTYWKKYGIYDWRGGGRASARETAARVAAGAFAQKVLEKFNINIFSYTLEFANIKAKNIDLNEIEKNPFFFPDKKLISSIESRIMEISRAKDSSGGIVETVVKNVPPGIGEPVFKKIEAILGMAILSIPAVKGIEFGAGFKAAKMLGSQNNDEISYKGFISNNAGGMLGGISNGEDIIFRVAVKPIPSIGIPQKSIDINRNPIDILIKGRHDVSAIPRIVPVIKAMTRIAILDLLLINNSKNI
jgi:chorismate synthase